MVLLGVLLLGTAFLQESRAQRFAYVDVKYILKNIPEYQRAQKKVDSIARVWRQQIENKKDKLEKMRQNFREERVLLTDKMRKKRKKEIIQKEKEIKQLRDQRFGYEGDLFKKKRELVQPIQDKVYKAIETIAERRRYDFILDKSAGTTLLYTNSEYDKSKEVLKELGYSPQQQNKKDSKK